MNLAEIKKFIEYKQNEKFSGLPILIPSWKEYLPALAKGQYIIISAGVGVGKTTFTLDKMVLDQISFVSKNPDIDCFYTYFSLEETPQRMDLKILSRFLYQTTKLEYGIQDFLNLDGSKKVLTHINELDKTKLLVDTFNSKVDVVGDCRTPKQIKAKINETIHKLGSKIRDKNFYYIVVIDNLKFVKGDNNQSQKDAIDEIAIEILQEVRVKHEVIPIVVQHQNRQGETPLYDYKKNIIVESVRPTLSGLGVSTYTQDPATHVIGIFDPNRYGVLEYPLNNGYDISVLGDNQRFLSALKGRDGICDDVACYFNGKVSLFEELKSPSYYTKNGYGCHNLSHQKQQQSKKKSSWQTQLDIEI